MHISKLYQMKEKGFPVLHPERHLNPYDEFPCFELAPSHTTLEEIPIQELYGDNWAFDTLENRGNYPRLHKLESLLKGYESNSDIPPVDVLCIDGQSILVEGNHRYYLSMLLKRPTLYARIVHYHYRSFLEQTSIGHDGLEYYLSYEDDKRIYITEEDKRKIEQLLATKTN